MMISRRLNAPLLIAAGAALFYFLGMAWLTHLAHGAVVVDTVPGPIVVAGDTTWDLVTKDGPWWAGLLVLAGAGRVFLDKQHWLAQGKILSGATGVLMVVSAVLAWHFNGAPVSGILTALLAGYTLVTHSQVPGAQPPAKSAPTSTSGGSAAMLALLLLGGMALGQSACAGTGATVKKEATYLEGCDASDASTIIAGMKALADDAKALKAGGDRVAAATDVIVQLALINAAWQHCKATSAQDAGAH